MPFLKTTKEGKSELQVRASLALLFASGATVGFFLRLITPESYMTLVTMAVSFYFAKRGETDNNKKKLDENNPVQ